MRARRIVEQLLQEATLNPVLLWPVEYLARRIAERMEDVAPGERLEHEKALGEIFQAFHRNKKPIQTPDEKWWMPFPYGWRLIGNGKRVITIISPKQVCAEIYTENPFISNIHKTYWRGILGKLMDERDKSA